MSGIKHFAAKWCLSTVINIRNQGILASIVLLYVLVHQKGADGIYLCQLT
jgi:hypothetical protein